MATPTIQPHKALGATLVRRERSQQLQRKAAVSFGVTFVVVLLAIALTVPNPTSFQYTVFRIVLALAAAGVAATIPGFIELEVRDIVRAGGALAIFVLVYFYNPAQRVVSASDVREAHRAPVVSGSAATTLTPIDQQILDAKAQIMGLQSKYETTFQPGRDRDINREARSAIQTGCANAAKMLDSLSPDNLTVDIALTKLGYAGIGWTLGAATSLDRSEAATQSAKAIKDLKWTLSYLDAVDGELHRNNSADLVRLVSALESDRFRERTTHFLAMAQATNALSGGKATVDQAVRTYRSLPSAFRRSYPPKDNVQLSLAFAQYHSRHRKA